MESKFECFLPCSAPVTRELILSLSAQLRRLADRERGANKTDTGGGITLFCGADTLRFSSEEELTSHVPPLVRIDGFHLSVLLNPWRMRGDSPSMSLHVHRSSGSEYLIITAEAVTQARAQELALEIVASLSASTGKAPDQKQRKREPKRRKRADRDGKEPQKFYHSGTFWAAVSALATVAAAVIALLALLHSLGFL